MNRIKKIVAVLCIIYAMSCHEDSKTKSAIVTKVDSVSAFILENSVLDKTVSLPGELLPNEKIQVFGKVNGYVKKILVDIGSVVKKGEVLAILDAPEIQSKIAESKQRVESMKSKWAGSKDLYTRLLEASKSDGVIAPVDLERAKSQLATDASLFEGAKSALKMEEQAAEYLILKSPFNGIVTKRNIDIGAFIGKAGEMPLLELEDNTTLRLRIAIPEVFTDVIVKDEKVQFTIKAIPGKKFEGILSRKSGSLDANTRSELWEFSIPNENRVLKSGMFADCKMNITRKEKSFFVPFSSIVTTLERKFVIKVSSDTTSWIDIGQGINMPEKVEIFGKLKVGDSLVLKSNEELKSGVKVIIKLKK